MFKGAPTGCKFELLEAILDNFSTIVMLFSQNNRASLLQYLKFSLRILAFKHALRSRHEPEFFTDKLIDQKQATYCQIIMIYFL
ncbi:hypothetical protein PEDI_36030 [Persicobacter diffluens]|uniref:Uncharacterized protein n=1 Tax=Persicobacter diffluens TaxID=981 RepID=A0AAN4VZS7_9BACT|nr:hypothetical protein PEDI_36030 [Persicobacter diffluens]